MDKILPIDVIDKFCIYTTCRKPIENWTSRKKHCDFHSPTQKEFKQAFVHSGFLSVQLESNLIDELEAMIKDYGYINRTAYLRALLGRELLEWKSKALKTDE